MRYRTGRVEGLAPYLWASGIAYFQEHCAHISFKIAFMRSRHLALIAVLFLLSPFTSQATVQLAPYFSDNTVLQRGDRTPVWGAAAPGEVVTLTLGNQKITATAGPDGKWKGFFHSLTSAEGLILTASGSSGTEAQANNVDVGDVWVCSGQSNMAFHLADADEANAVNRPHLRYFSVPNVPSSDPVVEISSKWEVADPQVVRKYTAVGYYFAKYVQDAVGVPIGLIRCDWSGTSIEPWIPLDALQTIPEFKDHAVAAANDYRNLADDAAKFPGVCQAWQAKYGRTDPGNKGFAAGWASPDAKLDGWTSTTTTGDWTTLGLPNGGVIWARKTVFVPKDVAGSVNGLFLGWTHDTCTVYLNGQEVGTGGGTPPYFWNDLTQIKLPPGSVRPGADNTLALRIVCQAGKNPSFPPGSKLGFRLKDPVSDEWFVRVETAFPPLSPDALATLPKPPILHGEGTPAAIYNGMVFPLTGLAIKGVLWYQGESSTAHAWAYRTFLPALIDSWRARWNQGDFPFYVVQLPNFGPPPPMPGGGDDRWPELRESQLLTAEKLPNVGMAVTIDVGEAGNLHPPDKRDVGHRLALLALERTYGKPGESSGPIFESMEIAGAKIRLHFSHLGGGLVAKDGPLQQFVIAGADKKWFRADAAIDGETVVVSSPDVPAPAAVRYAWAGNPAGCNLYSQAGLPASPFRTDDWPLGTQNSWF